MPNYPRIIAEMSRLHWAITPEAMEGIKLAVECGLKEKDRAAFHANSAEEYEVFAAALGELVAGARLARVKGPVGSLFIAGPLVPRASALAESSGVVSVDRLASEFKMLEQDASVTDILLVFDSPGGAIAGISEFASAIEACTKRVTAYVAGMACSAAYWLSSSADSIVSSPTGLAGNIGTISVFSVNKEDGKIIISNTQSPYKNPDVTTKKGLAVHQTVVDDLAAVFFSDVAKGRGTTVEKVMAEYGKGAALVAFRALESGVIDKIDTLENTLKALGAKGNTIPAFTSGAEGTQKMVTLDSMIAEHPELKSEVQAKEQAAKEAGALEEREQFTAKVTAVLPFLQSENYPTVIKSLALKVLSGESSPGEFTNSMAVYEALKAEKTESAAIEDSQREAVNVTVAGEVSSDGILRTSADMDAEILAARGEGE